MIKSRRIRWAGHIACVRDRRDACRVLVGKHEGKRPLGKAGIPNIKLDIQKVGWVGMDWIDLAQNRDMWQAVVNAVMNLQVP